MRKDNVIVWALVLLCLALCFVSCTTASTQESRTTPLEAKFPVAKLHRLYGAQAGTKFIQRVHPMFVVGDTVQLGSGAAGIAVIDSVDRGGAR